MLQLSKITCKLLSIYLFIIIVLINGELRPCYSGQSRPENTLAGIKLGRPVETVLRKYGTPTRISIPMPKLEQQVSLN